MTESKLAGWFHCFSGIAGDMALGALVDAGADLEEVSDMCARLPVGGWTLEAEPTMRGGIAATKVHVHAAEEGVIRTAAHITGLVEEARLPERVRARALGAFHALAEAEGRLHQRPPEQVHFHEVGGVDAIIDIVGTCSALEVLGVDEVYSSPIAQGRGMVRSAHGLIPNPAPAVVELLRGAPTYGIDESLELTTPTGAALMASTVVSYGALPAMVVAASGFGAGTATLEDRPNLVQIVLGHLDGSQNPGQPVTLVETNVDDITGETIAHSIAALLEAGAHDAWVTPIVMKKGRPAYTISALADPAVADQVAQTLVSETGSLGVRAQRLERWPQERSHDTVDVAGRSVRVKVSAGRVKVEHDDAARAARQIGRPLREVISLAEEAWRRQGEPPPDGDGPDPGGPRPVPA
jgi:uncharacterized protein (TIGR00299 family) protein